MTKLTDKELDKPATKRDIEILEYTLGFSTLLIISLITVSLAHIDSINGGSGFIYFIIVGLATFIGSYLTLFSRDKLIKKCKTCCK